MARFDDIFFYALLLSNIREHTHILKEMFNGVLLTSLMYENKKEEKRKKKRFYEKTKEEVIKLNHRISMFNKWKNEQFRHVDAGDLEKVDLKNIKKIIYEHKGDYKIDKSKKRKFNEKLEEYIIGTGTSASSLSKRNTHLKLDNTLIQSINSQIKFLENMEKMIYLPFGGKGRKFKVRKNVEFYISEAIDIYSSGFFEIAVFIIGRTLEGTITDYLIILKKNKKINYKIKEIKTWDFENKINILKKENYLTPSQFSKIMSIKWDRNILGHYSTHSEIKQVRNDADATIKIGLNLIEYLERKIKRLS